MIRYTELYYVIILIRYVGTDVIREEGEVGYEGA
jgi:hypothetical protein